LAITQIKTTGVHRVCEEFWREHRHTGGAGQTAWKRSPVRPREHKDPPFAVQTEIVQG